MNLATINTKTHNKLKPRFNSLFCLVLSLSKDAFLCFWGQNFLIFGLALLFLLSRGKGTFTGDSVPYRYLPIALLKHGTFRLDAFPHLAEPQYYAIVRDRQGSLISKKPVTPALFEVPFFLGYAAFKGKLPQNEWTMMQLGRLTMCVISAIACVLLAMSLKGLHHRFLPLLGGLGLVMMTPFWFTALDCWPHPLLAALNAACLLLISRRKSQRTWVFIGLFQGIAITTRLGAGVVSLVFLAAALLEKSELRSSRMRHAAGMILGALPPLILLGWYNQKYFGNPFTTGFGSQVAGRIRAPFGALAGLLVSPAKGIFLYSPIFVFGFASLRKSLREKFEIRLSLLCLLFHTLLWSFYADWWGGWAWGPRYLMDVMPFALFIACISIDHLLAKSSNKKRLLILIIVFAVLSFAIQCVGIMTWNGEYHRTFDKGWGEGRNWVWKSPYEPLWRLVRMK